MATSSTVCLVFQGRSLPVPKRFLFDLFEHRPELFQATKYAVQSAVPLVVFEMFVDSLKSQSGISVTKGNAAPLSLLASEFFLAELAAQCAAFSVPVDQPASLSDRVRELELRFSHGPGDVEEEIAAHERGLERLRWDVDRIDSKVDELVQLVTALRDSTGGEIGTLKCEAERVATSVSNLETLRGEFATLDLIVHSLQRDSGGMHPPPKAAPLVQQQQQQPTSKSAPASLSKKGQDWKAQPPRRAARTIEPATPPSSSSSATPPTSASPSTPSPAAKPMWTPPSTSSSSTKPTPDPQVGVEIPITTAKSLDGIIAYLTKEHGGNVHEKGIVNVTSKSVDSGSPKMVADQTNLYFRSEDEPGQWLCWDFRQMRVRPTYYTIHAINLKSWVVEGSMDGTSWAEIDRQTDLRDFGKMSFVVTKPAEFRYVRLTQTGESSWQSDRLVVYAVEFFGTLFE
jgi:hypothetical protein